MLPHNFLQFLMKLFSGALILISTIMSASAQYGPLYWDLRNYDSIPAYRDAMHAFDARNYDRAMHILDSVADVLSSRGEMHRYYTVQNEKGAMLYISNRYNESLEGFTRNLELMRSAGDTLNNEYAITLRFLAYLDRIGYDCKYGDDLELIETEFRILTIMNDSSPIYADCLSDLGMRYLSRNMKHKALNVLIMSRELAKYHREMNSLLITDHTIVNHLGNDQPTLSLRVFESMYHTTPCKYFRDSMSMAVLAYSIAERLGATGNHDKTLFYLDQAELFNNATGNLQHSLISGIPLCRALSCAEMGDYHAFKSNASQALAKYMINPKVNGYPLSTLYLSLTSGWMHFSGDSALIYAHKAAEHITSSAQKQELNYLLGKISLNQGDTLKAIEYLEKAAAINDDNDLQISTSPILLKIYKELVQVYTQEMAYSAYCHYDTVAVGMVNKITDREELLRMSADYHQVAGILLNSTTTNLCDTLIFGLVSKAKAFALAGAVAMHNYGLQAAKNDSLWLTRVQLEEEVMRLENHNIEEQFTKGTVSDSAMAFHLRESLIRLLATNLKIMSDHNTENLTVNNISLKDIQSMLDDNHVIIDIFRSGERIIVTGINKNSLIKFNIDDSNDFDANIEEYRERLKTGSDHLIQSRNLGKTILTPLAGMLKTAQVITFIPDSKLQQVPLDLMVNPANNRILLETHQVTYHYSLSLWGKSQKQRSGTGTMLAIAPIYTGTDQLPGSAKEVAQLSNLFKTAGLSSTTLIGEKATKENIKAHLPGARILHIAAHTRREKGFDRLVGIKLYNQNDYLYTGEFETISKNLSLVVLSGCNTAIGDIHEAEGALALTRGLIIGGVPNIIATLWKINDHTTESLITDFYSYLLQNNDYAEALRLARLKRLRNGDPPLHWAGFVLISK